MLKSFNISVYNIDSSVDKSMKLQTLRNRDSEYCGKVRDQLLKIEHKGFDNIQSSVEDLICFDYEWIYLEPFKYDFPRVEVSSKSKMFPGNTTGECVIYLNSPMRLPVFDEVRHFSTYVHFLSIANRKNPAYYYIYRTYAKQHEIRESLLNILFPEDSFGAKRSSIKDIRKMILDIEPESVDLRLNF